jgi:hypothetical protein
MILRVDCFKIYILEQQHRVKNSKSTISVKSVAVPDVIFDGYGSIRKLYVRGCNSFYDNAPLKCGTLQNLSTAIKHLSVWSITYQVKSSYLTSIKIDDVFRRSLQ